MHPEERKVYIALLIAGFIFLVVVVAFLITIINYQRKSVTAYLERVKADLALSEQDHLRWASDIHDEFGSKVSLLKLLLDDLVAVNNTERVLIRRMSDGIESLMQTIRQVSNNLVPYALQREGLIISLQELLDSLFANSPYTIIQTWQVNETDIPAENQIHIYRIVQELLNNIIRHAHATQIDISLPQSPEAIQLSVSDNGNGFNQKRVQKSSQGLGLRNITVRVNSMKGSIYLTTSPGRGSHYHIVLPFH